MRDHPGMGGEEISIRSVYQSFQGSPPRRRGKADKDDVSGLDLGITPAWAGKSFDSLTVCRRLRDHPRMGGEKLLDRYWIGTGLGDTKDHPRMGGEKFCIPVGLSPGQGSPPHGRGKAGLLELSKECVGITPAQAGKRQLNYDGGRL